MDSKQKKALEQAIASVEMEGFRFTDKDRKLCEALVSGEISFAKFIEDFHEITIAAELNNPGAFFRKTLYFSL